MKELGEEVEQLAYGVIGAAIEVHRVLGPGFGGVCLSGSIGCGTTLAPNTFYFSSSGGCEL